MSQGPTEPAVLEVRDLRVFFRMERGLARAVDGVSFTIPARKTLALVGESGSGKSVTAMSLLRLIPSPPGVYAGGEVHFGGRDLLQASERELRAVRGNQIAMIFQEPMTSLNPVFTIGEQIAEAVRVHQGASRADARARAIGMLRAVKIPDPERRVDEYPHQLSGGMRQRVMIAMALCCGPKLLIADEPTTALDVTIQAQILELVQELQDTTGASILFITHDLGVVAEVADEVVVLYAGQVVESGATYDVLSAPQHPYTRGLLRARPDPGGGQARLYTIDGTVPSALDFPGGCRFAARCPLSDSRGGRAGRCAQEAPALRPRAPGHLAACHALDEGRSGI